MYCSVFCFFVIFVRLLACNIIYKNMKLKQLCCFIAFSVLVVAAGMAQKTYQYKTYPNDPFQMREYTLDNGLKVFLSVYKEAPRIQTYVAVRAGSKNDPAETTGLAHYLEHMMFKGTHRLGTTNWEREQAYIQQIEDLFEVYRMFDDSLTRAIIYHRIDSLSYEASKIAIANEYDKMMTNIGSTGTNAFTSNDCTMYVENIPSNQVETWCELQADRFENLVLRLFHTELEAVYEEKNMTLTQDGRRCYEEILRAMFPHHPYGQQTTIGEAEHLKNPSMRNIRKFYSEYYVPNNICISMAGDFDPDEVIKIIDKYWGHMKPGNVPQLTFPEEAPITSPIVKNITGNDPENTYIAYRLTSKVGERDRLIAELLDKVLNNGKSGLIDVNLNQPQKCLGAYSGVLGLNDYGVFELGGRPNEGQTLQQLQQLLFDQINLVKQGKFDESLLEAAINNQKLSIMKQAESNSSRAIQMAYAFINHQNWGDVCNEINVLATITKQDIVDFANRTFKDNNYFILNKLQGTPDPVYKVAKPAITPIEVGRDNESEYLRQLKARTVTPIEPRFVNFDKDMKKSKLANGAEVLYVQNVENATFNLDYYFDFGSNADKKIDFAADLFGYLGTSKHTLEQIKAEFYKLACSYSLSVGGDNITVSISGLSENMQQAMALMEELMSDCQPDDEALKTLIDRIVKSRQDSKTNQGSAFSALCNYGIYGPDNSPTLDQLTEAQMRAFTAKELTDAIHDLFNYKHRVLYYGPETLEGIKSIVAKGHFMPKKFKAPLKNKNIQPLAVKEPVVYFVDYDSPQVRLRGYNRSVKYDFKLTPVVNLYNEYFGGSMNAIVFQEMREKRSLAYSANAYFSTPGKPINYFSNNSFIGTQNDKLSDAMVAFEDLFENMPVAEANFAMAKDALLSGIRTQRTIKRSIIFNYLSYERMGFDTRKPVSQYYFNAYPSMTMQDVIDFNKKYIKGQKKVYMLLGKESDIDFEALKKYGRIEKLTLEQIFGY